MDPSKFDYGAYLRGERPGHGGERVFQTASTSSSSSGLSRPRLMKVRRHFPSNRRNSGLSSESFQPAESSYGVEIPANSAPYLSSLNQNFRDFGSKKDSVTQETGSSDGNSFAFGRSSAQKSTAQWSRECSNNNWGSSQPVESSPGVEIPSKFGPHSSNLNQHFGNLRSEKDCGPRETESSNVNEFAFGRSSAQKISDQWPNISSSGVEFPANFGPCSSSSNQNFRNFGPGESILNRETVSSAGNVFTFGMTAQKSSGSTGAEKLPEKFQRLNFNQGMKTEAGDHKLGSCSNNSEAISPHFYQHKQTTEPFIYRGTSTERGAEEKLPSYLSQLNINDLPSETNQRFSTAGTQKPVPVSSMFHFQGKAKQPNHDDHAASVLPEEMGKLKIEEVNKPFTFVFGNSNGASGLPEENNSTTFSKTHADKPSSGKNEGEYRFGFRSEYGFGFANIYQNSGETAEKLPEEIQKLKIRDLKDDAGTRIDSFGGTHSSGGAAFVFTSKQDTSRSISEEKFTKVCNLGGKRGTDCEETLASESSNRVEAENPRQNKGQGISPNSNGLSFVNSSEMDCTPNDRPDSPAENSAGKLPEEIQKLKIVDPNDHEAAMGTSSGFSFSSTKNPLGSLTNENPTGFFVFGRKAEGFDQDVRATGCSNGASFVECGTSSNETLPGSSLSTDASDNNNQSKTEPSDYVSANSSFTSDGGSCFYAQSDESYSSKGVFVFGSTATESKHSNQDRCHLPDRYDKSTVETPEFDFRFSEAGCPGNSEPSIFEEEIVSQNVKTSEPLFNFGDPIREQTASSFCPIFQTTAHDSVFSGFRTKKDDGPVDSSSSATFFGGRFNAKKEASSHIRARKRRGKLKETSREKSSEMKPGLDAHGGYSPMDFSPCRVESFAQEEVFRDSVNQLNDRNSSLYAEDLANEAKKPTDSEFMKEGCGDSDFALSASSIAQSSFSFSKHSQRRKFRAKVRGDDSVTNLGLNANSFNNSNLEGKKVQTEVPSTVQRQEHEGPLVKGGVPTSANVAAAQEACEKWRLKGNQAYSKGDLSKAEEYYSRGVKYAVPHKTSVVCKRTLVLSYSNRAAARMSDGRIRSALSDCTMATAIDPDFLRAQLRAANCYLLLGETEEACSHFKKLLRGAHDSSVDQKFVIEASDGLQKSKIVADCMEHASSFLQNGTANNAEDVLQKLADALSISPYSETLIEMKAEVLLMLGCYSDLILLIDETLDLAEKNFPLPSARDEREEEDSRRAAARAKAWRAYLKSRAHFYLGKLDEASEILKDRSPVKTVYDREKLDSWELLSTTVSELLRLKEAGNIAFKSGKHSEAIEHYTAALAYNIESRPFTAICFCNRAAAYQALGQITEAISDCSLAIALNPEYPKAISRRATLYEMIRDYAQSLNDLRRLITLLERKEKNKAGRVRPYNDAKDLPLARLRLQNIEDKQKGLQLDFYKILGIEASSDVAEIKKAYRKAALKFHPDKASQLLIKTESADEKLWKEVANEVHKEADQLFKMIGEAYAVLSDPTKRQKYDEGIGAGDETFAAEGRYYHPDRQNSGRYDRDEWWRSSSRTSYRTRRYYSGF